MKTSSISFLIALAVCFCGSLAGAQVTMFTYQGLLDASNGPVNGSYDLKFTLFPTNTGGVALAGPVTNTGVAVNGGLFTVAVDFGIQPPAGAWLEMGVQTNAGPGFVTLVPRQLLTPTPHAMVADVAGNLSGMLPASQISGAFAPGALAGYSGPMTAGTYYGNGSGLTNTAGSGFAPTNNPVFGGVISGNGAGLTNAVYSEQAVLSVTNASATGTLAITHPAVSAVKLVQPFITISPHGIADGYSKFTNGGAMFGPDWPGGTDASVWWQMALNMAQCYVQGQNSSGVETNGIGATIYSYPGEYHCYSQVVISNDYWGTLCIYGAGMTATKISDDSQNNQPFWTCSRTNDGDSVRLNFVAHNISWNRENDGSQYQLPLLLLGSLNNCDIQNCGFTTHTAWDTDGSNPALQLCAHPDHALGIVGLEIHSHYDNGPNVQNCFFSGLADGIEGHWDHPNIMRNQYGAIGIHFSGNLAAVPGTSYPTTAMQSLGACILNLGSGGGHFEDEHIFYANTYMVKSSDFRNGDNWYGNDTVRDVYYEETANFILSSDLDGAVCYNNVQGRDQGELAGSPPGILVNTLSKLGSGVWQVNGIAQGVLAGTTQPVITFQNPLTVAGPVQATAFTIGGTNGATANVMIQTNSGHGIILNFAKGLYLGQTNY